MTNEFLSLTNGCTAVTMPALAADPYCEATPGLSQIQFLVFTPCTAADPLEIVSPATQPTAVTGEIDNDNADNTKSRLILCQGGVAEHEPDVYEGAGERDYVTRRTYTATFQITLGDRLMYEFLRNLQRNWLGWRFWYVDLSGLIYGPVLASTVTDAYGGIRPNFVNVQMPKDAARDGRNIATVTIRWRATTEPVSYTSPFTLVDACAPA